MINYSVLDAKIKNLISVCKKTGNFKKITVSGFILTSNILDEIGIKLGVRPRDKDRHEKLYEYMDLINSIIVKSIGAPLFQEETIRDLQLIEVQFLKRKGNIPNQYITLIFKIYYSLRKLDIPNLHEELKDELITEYRDVKLYSLLSGEAPNKRKVNDDKFKILLMDKFKQAEKEVKRKLNSNYSKQTFEKAIHLKRLKSKLKEQDSEKQKVRGRLKDNLNYQRSLESIIGYSVCGVIALFLLVGIAIMVEAIQFPNMTMVLSPLIMMFIGASMLSLVVYWNYFYKRGR